MSGLGVKGLWCIVQPPENRRGDTASHYDSDLHVSDMGASAQLQEGTCAALSKRTIDINRLPTHGKSCPHRACVCQLCSYQPQKRVV